MKTKTLILVILTAIVNTVTFPISTLAACQIRTLKQVCDLCEERAINKLTSKLETDSIQTQPQEINCPATSLACIQSDSFKDLLKTNYTLTAKIFEGEEDTLFKLEITKDQNISSKFKYNVRYRNFRLVIQDSPGFLVYDIVNFNLPVTIGDKLFSYNCIGSIDNTSTLKGVCSTVAPDENGIVKPYSFSFNGIPNSSPLQ